MKIVLVAAFRSEASGILGLIESAEKGKAGGVKYWQGRIGPHEVSVVLCGAGPEKAAASLCQVDGIISGAELVINFGVCGALRTGGATPGQTVVMETVAAGWHAGSPPLELLHLDLKNSGTGAGGRLVTHLRPVFDSHVALQLARRFDAAYVDMEAWEVASFCRERKIPSAVVKAVSDRAGEDPAADPAAHARLAAHNCARAVYDLLLRM